MKLSSSTQQNLYKHKEIFNHLSKLYLNNKLPNKILLSGERGIGKATLGYHLINFVLSEDEEHSYDIENNKINLENKSFKLIQNKSNPNFNLIDVAEDKKNLFLRLKMRKSLNRYDQFNTSFYNKVQNGFLKMSKLNKKKYKIIDSNLDIKKNEKLIINQIKKLIK